MARATKQNSGPSAALSARMKASPAPAPSEDRLERVRVKLREVRDNEHLIADLEAKVSELKASVLQATQKDLPDLFDEANIDNLGLPAEGNLPAYDCKLGPYYHASIAADWPDEKREAAFQYLEKEAQAGDLIKSMIIIALPRGKIKLANRIVAGLEKLGVGYVKKLDVPWNTLTAWVKEQVEKRGTTPKLDLIGATVGRVVKLKERK